MKIPFVIRDEKTLAYFVTTLNRLIAEWAGRDIAVTLSDDATRTIEQNAVQWPILHEIAKEYEWPVNGAMRKMDEEGWKDLLTSAFRKEQAQVAQAWDGQGICLVGHKTREFGKREFSDWIEFLKSAREELKIRKDQAGRMVA
jgi:hypothetical protein